MIRWSIDGIANQHQILSHGEVIRIGAPRTFAAKILSRQLDSFKPAQANASLQLAKKQVSSTGDFNKPSPGPAQSFSSVKFPNDFRSIRKKRAIATIDQQVGFSFHLPEPIGSCNWLTPNCRRGL